VFKMRALEVVLLRGMLVGCVRERWLCLFGGVDVAWALEVEAGLVH